MVEIKYCPALLKPGFSTYSDAALKKLFGAAKVSPFLEFDIDMFRHPADMIDAMNRISVSGVQEKFPAIISDGKISISGQNQRSTHILKPSPWDNTLEHRKQIPANEHLTMQIAAQVYDIETAENGLCFTPSGQCVYITRRFDIDSMGNKCLMEDFASLIGKNELVSGKHFRYQGTYEDIAVEIKRHVAAWMVDMEKFFNLVVFNYIYGNGDSHLKNFSLIRRGNEYRLAPAYDLLNTSLHLDGDDFGLNGGLSANIEKSDVYERTGHPCRLDFERFAEVIGLTKRRTAKILNEFSDLPLLAATLINTSYLDKKMKRVYSHIVSERIQKFNRESS